MNPIQIRGHLQQRLHQRFLRQTDILNRFSHQTLRQRFHLRRNLRGTVKLYHLECTMDLVNRGQAGTHAAVIVKGDGNRLKRILSLLKGLEQLCLDPIQTHVILRRAHCISTSSRFVNRFTATISTLGR